jgi:hypothetical protein
VGIFEQFNYGTAGNQVQAKAIITAMKNTGFVFGIYSSPGVSYSTRIFIEQ